MDEKKVDESQVDIRLSSVEKYLNKNVETIRDGNARGDESRERKAMCRENLYHTRNKTDC